MGGVVRRFPQLSFAFLEGGVGWACSLYNDLVEHWEIRNVKAIKERLDPAKLDRTALDQLFVEYGGEKFAGKVAQMGKSAGSALPDEDPRDLDDWAAAKVEDPHDFATFFGNFYFGCEADDRMAAVAFNDKLNHFGVKLNAMFGSDIGHFDVPDITAVVAEAYELVEDGILSEDDFRAFTFTNAVKLHGSMNPDFFKGTSVEDAAARVWPSRSRRLRKPAPESRFQQTPFGRAEFASPCLEIRAQDAAERCLIDVVDRHALPLQLVAQRNVEGRRVPAQHQPVLGVVRLDQLLNVRRQVIPLVAVCGEP